MPKFIGQISYLTTSSIRRANFNGSGVEDLVNVEDVPDPRGIALDLTNQKMYWTDVVDDDVIRRADIDGSNMETLVTDLEDPFGIALDLDEGKMYWTDLGNSNEEITGKIQRANLDGSNVEDLITEDSSGAMITPYGIAIGGFNLEEALNFEYTAKMVCGLQNNPQDMRLARGFYATSINIHNPNNQAVRFFKKLALTYPPAEQRPGQIKPIAIDELQDDEALAVDCMNIQQEAFAGEFPEPYIKGFIVIQSPASLDVTSVYTTASLNQSGQVARHSSIDIEQVRERRLETDLEIHKEAEVISNCVVVTPASDFQAASFAFNGILYTIEVTNNGSVTAQNLIVRDTVEVDSPTLIGDPGDFTLISPTEFNFTDTTAELEATIPELAASQVETLQFVALNFYPVGQSVAQPTPISNFTNTATVSSDTFDFNLDNNTTTIDTQVVAQSACGN